MVTRNFICALSIGFLAGCGGGSSSETGAEDEGVRHSKADAGLDGRACDPDAGQSAPDELPPPVLKVHGSDPGLTVDADPARTNVVTVAGTATQVASFLSIDVDGLGQNFFSTLQQGDTAQVALERLRQKIEQSAGTRYLAALASLENGVAELTVTRVPGFDGKDHGQFAPGTTVSTGPNGHIVVAGATVTDQWRMSAKLVGVSGSQVTVAIDASTPTFVHHIIDIHRFTLDVDPVGPDCRDLHGTFHVIVTDHNGRELTAGDLSL